MDFYDKTGIPVTWYTSVASEHHKLDGLIENIEFSVVLCDQNFLFNKITPSIIIHIDIGLYLHDPFLLWT